MKYRISLILVFVLLFNFIFCPYVKAETFSDLDDILAVWDSNIDTSWDTVFNEYKTLDPQTMDKADTVIASNMFRYLMSVGSKPKGRITQTDYSNFVKATSPFYIAYHGITSAPEVTVHAAWSISSEAFKVFCANVIHNLAQQSSYYDTHVLKNDNFLNDAGKGHLNFIYNDIDNNTEINIANNIFNGNVLNATSSSVGVFFNPSPLSYTGPEISLSGIYTYMNHYNLFSNVYSAYRSRVERDYYGSYELDNSYLYLQSSSSSDLPLDHIVFNASIYYYDTSQNPYANFSLSCPGYTTSNNFNFKRIDLSSLTYPINYTAGNNYVHSVYSTSSISNAIIQSSNLVDLLKSYVSSSYFDLVKNWLVFTNYFTVNATISFSSGYRNSFTYTFYPSTLFSSFSSPQFVPVNIYNNQVYTSSEDTYWHVDQMVDNIINNDYSTVNNGTDNTFYINNYYVPETVSSGGIQLVTSSSIVYNYTTIINNNGISSGGSIGSYPYPFDVRIINPEDLQNETELNIKNDILNNYDIDLNAGDINSSINLVKDNFIDRIRSVAPATGGAMSWGPLMFSMIPSDWSTILWSFIIIMALICVYHHRK